MHSDHTIGSTTSPRSGEPQWTTEDEFQFIARLGTHAERERQLYRLDDEAYRLMALRGYREGLAAREEWGDIDAFRVVNYVNELIWGLEHEED